MKNTENEMQGVVSDLRKNFGFMAPHRVASWVGGVAFAGGIALSPILAPATAHAFEDDSLRSAISTPALLLAGSRIMGVIDATPDISDKTMNMHGELAKKLNGLNDPESDFEGVHPGLLRSAYMGGVRDATIFGYKDIQIQGMISSVMELDQKLHDLQGGLHRDLVSIGLDEMIALDVSFSAVSSGFNSSQMQNNDEMAMLSEFLYSDEIAAACENCSKADISQIGIMGLRTFLSAAHEIDTALLFEYNNLAMARDSRLREAAGVEVDLFDHEPDLSGCGEVMKSVCSLDIVSDVNYQILEN